MDIILTIAIIAVTIFFTISYQRRREGKRKQNIQTNLVTKVKKELETNQTLLKDHSKEFAKKEVLKVGENVYVAIGYGLANSIMIEGEDGVIIIDTLENCNVAKEVRTEFEKITKKPIVGIILTHFHADHAYGTQAFIEGREDEVEIFAHESFPQYYSQVMNVRSPITFKRGMRQFGVELPAQARFNAGIGIQLRMDSFSNISYVYPTKTFQDRMKVKLAGIELELVHAPGETNDQIIVWYKERKILFPADNIYKAFPNLYAIRGTMHRDTLQWADALNIILQLKPEVLVPQHTRPVYGASDIKDIVESYRDSILFVHDQTVRYMNKGLTGRQIAEIVKLPPHLANHPYLIEYYGTVEWSVRAVYNGYMGWFNGRPGDLHPLPVVEEAKSIINLAGGIDSIVSAATEAVAEGKLQWALQLTDYILDSETEAAEEVLEKVKDLRGTALVGLAAREVSAPGMNWYLTEQMVMNGHKIEPHPKGKADRIHAGSMRDLFFMLTCMLNAEAAADTMLTIQFHFSDTGESIGMEVRRGVVMLVDSSLFASPDTAVFTTDKVWRKILTKELSAAMAALSGDLKVKPGIQSLSTFFSFFDLE